MTPSPAPGQLQAVRDVEDDGVAELAEHRQRAHVDDQVVVAEAHAAFGDEHRLVALGGDLGNDVLHVLRRQELALLDVDRLAGPRRGDDQIGLPREERRDLQHVDDLGGGRGVRRLVNVGQQRQSRAGAHVGENAKAGVEARARETTSPTCGWPCRTTP